MHNYDFTRISTNTTRRYKKAKKVLDDILAEFEEFGIKGNIDISKDYTFVNFRVATSAFFFDFRIDLVTDKIVLYAYTHKQLTNLSNAGEYPLTMSNIDELLMAIQSYNNIYIPQFSKL